MSEEIQDQNLAADEEATSQSVEDNEKVEPTDKREGILDYIKKVWKGKEETAEEAVEETSVREGEVPSEFLEWAKGDGWTEKDIEEFAADKTDDELKELLTSMEEEVEEEEVEDIAEEQEKEEKDGDLEALKSSMKEELLKEVLQELGPKFESLDDFRAETDRRSKLNMFETANEIMDGAGKDIPALGSFEEMPRFTTGTRKGELIPNSPQFKARAEVFQLAHDLVQVGRAKNISEGMKDALNWYKGTYGQKEMERKVIRNLKAQEKKLSGARTGKETKKEFANVREEIIEDIKQRQRAAGT